MEKALKRSFPYFIFPTLIAFIIGFIIPFILGLWLSFNEFVVIQDTTFVGFRNYVRAFADGRLLYSLGFTACLPQSA